MMAAMTAGGPARAQSAQHDWATYAHDNGRTALNPGETTLSPANAGRLRQLWATSIDGGAITGQAILASGIATPDGVKDLAIVGTEGGRLAAIDVSNGHVIWFHDTGFSAPGCGDLPNGQFGISATAAFSRAEGRVYAMGGDGKLYAFAVATGAVVAGWPVTILPDPSTEHVYGGLTLDRGGVFVTTASMCDQHTYHGRVARVQTRNPPGITQLFYTDASQTSGNKVTSLGPGGGGIWGPGGVSVDTVDPLHPVFAATGNVLGSANEFDRFGDQLVALSSTLAVTASNYPALPNPNADVDFGSTPVLYRMLPSCPLSLAAINKNGLLFTYDRTALARGPTQRLTNNSYAGDVAYDHDRRQLIVSNLDSVEAWRLSSGCRLARAWSTPESSGPGGELGQAVSPPSLANGLIYYGNGAGSTLIVLDARSGASVFTATLAGPVFAAPAVVGGRVLVSAWDGRLYAFGL